MSDWTTYREAFASTSTEIQEVLQSEKIGELIDTIERRSTTVVNRQEMLMLVSDYILGLTDETMLGEKMEGILDKSEVSAIKKQIDSLLKSKEQIGHSDTTVSLGQDELLKKE